jgi:hypothetical protein
MTTSPSSDSVIVLIDGDPLVYRAGFAAEEYYYLLHFYGDGKYYTPRFENAWRRDRYIELQGLVKEEYVSERMAVPGPVEWSLSNIRRDLERIKQDIGAYLYEYGKKIDGVRLFLSGPTNFRDKLAAIKGYKANRDRTKRPYWYREIREYMVAHHGAEIVDGFEADDKLAMIQWNNNTQGTLIATIDKDLLMVPGLHYNTKTREPFYQSYQDAVLAFYRQLLTGDGTDNIQGLWKVGEAKANKLLPEYAPEKIMYQTVLDAYIDNVLKYPEKHLPHKNGQDSLVENARLLWMMTHEDELWTPPGFASQSLALYLEANFAPDDPDEEFE